MLLKGLLQGMGKCGEGVFEVDKAKMCELYHTVPELRSFQVMSTIGCASKVWAIFQHGFGKERCRSSCAPVQLCPTAQHLVWAVGDVKGGWEKNMLWSVRRSVREHHLWNWKLVCSNIYKLCTSLKLTNDWSVWRQCLLLNVQVIFGNGSISF